MADVAGLEEYMASANDALQMSLVAPSKTGLQLLGTFHPKFTYPIFGEEEKIYGYKDLRISLRFRANDMRPHLKVSHGKKMKPIGELEPVNVPELLEQGAHLPKIAFLKETDFEDSSRQMSDDWTPPGKLLSKIDAPDAEYEVWTGSLADPAIKQLHSRVQIMVPLFIEGGSYIGQKPDAEPGEFDYSDAHRWTLFFLYRKQPSTEDPSKFTYTFCGYSTVYRFFHFQPPTPPASPGADWELPKGEMDLAQLPCRTRLSQFVIIPTFQGKGNGAKLYKVIFDHYHKHNQTFEFTVEDPNEAFDDLRDACDLAFLRTVPEFMELKIDTSVSLPKSGLIPQLIKGSKSLEDVRLKTKIATRQFYRLLEMHLMSQLPTSVRPTMALDDDIPTPTKADKHQERLWQLVVKQRLYRHNKYVLSEFELPERIDKLQETLGSVELEYARLLAAFDRARKHVQSAAPKRKVEEVMEEVMEAPLSKKARVDDA